MYQVPELNFKYDALEPFIDEATMRVHHDKHHAAYVKNLNDALEQLPQFHDMPVASLLQQLPNIAEPLRTKIKNHGGGHYNHSFFWQILCPPTGKDVQKPTGALAEALNATFGSFDSFVDEFTKKALGRFGSGWAWLVVHEKKLLITDSANQDSPVLLDQIPLLGLDVWEHAYYLRYQNRRDSYIESFFHVVNWKEVARKYASALENKA